MPRRQTQHLAEYLPEFFNEKPFCEMSLEDRLSTVDYRCEPAVMGKAGGAGCLAF